MHIFTIDGTYSCSDSWYAAYSASMNSNFSVTNGRGKVCSGFFHELKLHLQFPGIPLGSRNRTRSLTVSGGSSRACRGVNADPVTEGAFVDTELLAVLAIGRDVSITIFRLLL